MDDERIIELFFARSENAIRKLDDKYGHLFQSVSYNILNNRLDAEECVNDAYLGTWNAIPPAKPNPLYAFVCKIVRNISLKRYDHNNVTQSFSKPGTPHDNSVMESFFSNLKREELYRGKYRSERELRAAIDKYMNFYNTKRPHETLKYKTPQQKEEEYARAATDFGDA